MDGGDAAIRHVNIRDLALGILTDAAARDTTEGMNLAQQEDDACNTDDVATVPDVPQEARDDAVDPDHMPTVPDVRRKRVATP